jgi:hypothetical protein
MTYVMIYSPFDDVLLSSLKKINLTRRECKSYDKNELGCKLFEKVQSWESKAKETTNIGFLNTS